MTFILQPPSSPNNEVEDAIAYIQTFIIKPLVCAPSCCSNCDYFMKGEPPACNAFHVVTNDIYSENECKDWENLGLVDFSNRQIAP